MPRLFAKFCLAVAVILAPWWLPDAAARKVDLHKIPGYTYRSIQGFPVLIQSEVLQNDEDPRWKRKPTEVLEYELRTINQVLPERLVSKLRKLVIWVEWQDAK